YHTQIVFEIEGRLDCSSFLSSFQRLVERHPMLRAQFELECGDEPLQVIKHDAPLVCRQIDWSNLTSLQQQVALDEYLTNDRMEGFDLKRAPLMRVALMEINSRKHVCVWSTHHLIMDGWSAAVVLKELFDALSGAASSRGEAAMFRHFVLWL